MATRPTSRARHRPEPRISANELAKYMVTPEPGRIGIIRRARDSITPPRARYSDLRIALTGFLADMHRDRRPLDALAGTLNQRANDSSLTNFSRQDAQASLGALNAFQRMLTNRLAGYAFMPAPARQTPLPIGGVSVSINLDLLLRRERGDRQEAGAAMFRLTKADDEETDAATSKRKEMGIYAATLVQMQVAATVRAGLTPHHELCMSIDVQSGDIHAASRNFAQRAQRLEAACRFIAALWATA
jgi:hypothetical protein